MEQAQYLWLDSEITTLQNACVDILSYTLHYGYGIFEGLRAYETSKGPAIFRLSDHTNRFFNSAHILNIKIPVDRKTLNQAHVDVLRKNQFKSAYLRPLCYLGTGIGLHSKNLTPHVMVASMPWDAYMGQEKLTKGLSLKTSTIIRHNVNSVFTRAKATGNYLNSILALQEAQACQCDEALMLDNEGFVTEASAQNIFIVEKGKLITPDLSSALPGITRDTVITFANDLGIPVIERRFSRDEIYSAEEAFITGTAAEITPIHSLDFRQINTGKPGPMTKMLQERYFKTVQGEMPEYMHWLTFVEECSR